MKATTHSGSVSATDLDLAQPIIVIVENKKVYQHRISKYCKLLNYLNYLENKSFQELKMKTKALAFISLLALLVPALTNPTPDRTPETEDSGNDQPVQSLEYVDPGPAKVITT